MTKNKKVAIKLRTRTYGITEIIKYTSYGTFTRRFEATLIY